MCTAECVHNKCISDRSQILAEGFDVLGFFLAETGVFQNNDLTVLHLVYSSSYSIIYNNIRRNKSNLCGNQFSQTSSSSLQRELFLRTILRLAQMRAQNYLCTFRNQLVDGRQCCLNTVIICDNAVLHRNIEVHANQNTFAGHFQIVYRYFV